MTDTVALARLASCSMRTGLQFAVGLGVLGCGAALTPSGQHGAMALNSPARTSIELAGPWWFKRVAGHGKADDAVGSSVGDWMPATVPGCVHTDLLSNGKIADPFYGTNEKDLQWIDKYGWEYRTSFSVDDALLSRDRIEIVWKGLDTYARVLLNGTPILTANNMFREWRVDVKPLVRRGENTLLVQFESPIAEATALYDKLGYALPATNDQATPMVSMFTRKAPYHYGWDWGPRFVTSGIWRPVLLEAWNDARIDDVQVMQTSLTQERATLVVKTTVVAARAGRGRVTVAIAGGPPLGEVEATLGAGANLLEGQLTIDRPELWWPNGLGKAYLYDVQVALSVEGVARDSRAVRTGLRTLEVVHESDKDGKSFTIRVNGAPVFMKGANYIPSDSFLPRITTERYRWLVQSAADANMNMLRVWGGGIYEDDRFYDACDELGILVWQDFMFACSMYPGAEDFVANVRAEATQNVRRLRNHPSIALWAGNNEIEGAWHGWGWQQKFQLSKATQDRIWDDYKRMFHQVLPKVVAENDPARFYTRSSPSANDDRIPPDTLGFGDMHYWGVWHAEKPYTEYATNVSRFMSEYGFQSFPEISTVARYAPSAEWRIDSPPMLAHQRHPRGNELIRAYMDRDFRTPKDFDSFLYLSQVLQATIIQYGAEAHRRRWPYNAGSLYWQLDDCWPVASWSGIDYFGNWKALHYFARRFFSPVLVSAVSENGTIAVYVVSDRREDAPVRLVVRLIDFDGRELWRNESAAQMEANASKVYFEMPEREILGAVDLSHVVLVAEAFEGAQRLSRSLHYFVKTKDLDLPEPDLRVEVLSRTEDEMTVRIGTRRLARAVRLSADATEGAFSDNYFDLLPGESVTAVWKGPPIAGVKAASIRDTF
ncbi:MAG: glycoside hydrolase family 2 protein [Myxococcota bacterium]|nr:glycoside hydrolase family 2 protein [Myxococcota bacterium]